MRTNIFGARIWIVLEEQLVWSCPNHVRNNWRDLCWLSCIINNNCQNPSNPVQLHYIAMNHFLFLLPSLQVFPKYKKLLTQYRKNHLEPCLFLTEHILFSERQICRMQTTTEIEFFCSAVLLKTCVNIYLRRCLLFPQSSIKNVIKYFVQFPVENEVFLLKYFLKKVGSE